jgi:hypothetical protein
MDDSRLAIRELETSAYANLCSRQVGAKFLFVRQSPTNYGFSLKTRIGGYN